MKYLSEKFWNTFISTNDGEIRHDEIATWLSSFENKLKGMKLRKEEK